MAAPGSSCATPTVSPGSGIPGCMAELVAAPQLQVDLRRSLRQLKRQVEHQRMRADAARRRSDPAAASG